MNKSKIMLAAVGGVIGVAVLAAAFLAWQSWSAVSEARDGGDSGDGLDTVVARAASLSRKDVYPCAENVKAIDANRERFEEWRDEAARLAALRDALVARLCVPGGRVRTPVAIEPGDVERHLPNLVPLLVAGEESETLAVQPKDGTSMGCPTAPESVSPR